MATCVFFYFAPFQHEFAVRYIIVPDFNEEIL